MVIDPTEILKFLTKWVQINTLKAKGGGIEEERDRQTERLRERDSKETVRYSPNKKHTYIEDKIICLK